MHPGNGRRSWPCCSTTAWRLAGRETAAWVGGFGAVSLLWVAFAFWVRVAEVPDVTDRFDLEEFLATMPAPDHNEAGRLTRGAFESLESLRRRFGSEQA